MPLSAGHKLGPYEIVSPLGAGGMGEVYRARDSKLKREVALKVLPADVANDRERLARFQREAEVLASLNHPNIAHVHGLEDNALVMELVEGEDLAERLKRGPIPIDEALPIAKQIADALEAAHEQGIVHRDLKPANVKVRPDGTVKVLDFGLAKAFDPGTESREPGADLANSPTITSPAMTQRGVILGTAAYMSPEQAKGRLVDRRTDLWAFGCLLYELLTGKRAFRGDDITDTLTAIMRDEPDWSALPPDTPEPVRRLLRRCLQKDARQRMRDAGDARLDLDSTERIAVSGSPPRRSPARLAMIGGGGLLLGALVAALLLGTWSRDPGAPPITRLSLSPTIAAPLGATGGFAPGIAITPDGRRVIYAARRLDADGDRISAGQLISRDLGTFEETPLRDVGIRPNALFTSPDNAWIGFETVTGVKLAPVLAKAAAGGGPMTVLCDLGPQGELRGASWGRDGRIVFATNQDGTGLQVIADAGGMPTVLTTPDVKNGETNHRWPEILPNDAGILFTIQRIVQNEQFYDLAVLPRGSQTWRLLIRGTGAPRYLAPGYIVYGRDGVLYGVRFDLRSLSVQGQPVPIVNGVLTKPSAAAEFAVAGNGTLAFVPDSIDQVRQRLIWLGRDGSTAALPLEPRGYTFARLSPDGRRIAVSLFEDGRMGISIYDLRQGTFTRLLPRDEPADSPTWSPDSKRIAFWSLMREGIYTVAVDGSDPSVQLAAVKNGRLFPQAWSPDGRSIAFTQERPQFTVQAVATAAPHDVRPLGSGSAAQADVSYSLDGRWIAHVAYTGVAPEVVVGPADNPVRRWPIADRGRSPAWSPDGREVLFLEAGAIHAVPIDPATGQATGRARKVVDMPPRVTARSIEPTSDGKRFLVLERAAGETPRTEIRIVLNWLEELRTKLTPAGQ